MPTAQKQILIALFFFFAVSAGIANPGLSKGLVLDFRNGAGSLKLRDSSPAKNVGRFATIIVSNSPSLVSMQGTRELTLALWIKPNTLPREFPFILAKGVHNTPGTNGGYELAVNSNGDNDVIFYSGNFSAYTANANGSLVNNHLGEWIHLAVTVDATAETIQFYVNGKAFSNIATYGNLADVNFNVTNDLYIGTHDPNADAPSSTFDGDIRQVMIYNRALSAEEVQKIFSSSKPK